MANEGYRATGVDNSYSDIIEAKFMKARQKRAIQLNLQFFQCSQHKFPFENLSFYGASIFDFDEYYNEMIDNNRSDVTDNLSELRRVLAENAIVTTLSIDLSSDELLHTLRAFRFHLINLQESNEFIIGSFRKMGRLARV